MCFSVIRLILLLIFLSIFLCSNKKKRRRLEKIHYKLLPSTVPSCSECRGKTLNVYLCSSSHLKTPTTVPPTHHNHIHAHITAFYNTQKGSTCICKSLTSILAATLPPVGVNIGAPLLSNPQLRSRHQPPSRPWPRSPSDKRGHDLLQHIWTDVRHADFPRRLIWFPEITEKEGDAPVSSPPTPAVSQLREASCRCCSTKTRSPQNHEKPNDVMKEQTEPWRSVSSAAHVKLFIYFGFRGALAQLDPDWGGTRGFLWKRKGAEISDCSTHWSSLSRERRACGAATPTLCWRWTQRGELSREEQNCREEKGTM